MSLRKVRYWTYYKDFQSAILNKFKKWKEIMFKVVKCENNVLSSRLW